MPSAINRAFKGKIFMTSESIFMDHSSASKLANNLIQAPIRKIVAFGKRFFGLNANRVFSATRWFTVLALVTISGLSVATASILSRIMSDLMLHHDGVVAMQFVQGLLKTHDIQPFFLGAHGKNAVLSEFDPNGGDRRLQQFFTQVAALPDVLHANVYDLERRVIWSSNSAAINRVMSDNDELNEALEGKLVIESSPENIFTPAKLEHFFLNIQNQRFVENYIPIFDSQHKSLLGVVEIYKSPTPIFSTIDTLIRWIWLCALFGGALLFVSLYWIMRRAERVMHYQQGQLAANEAMVAVGEVASAVAHGIRNPLASIRTSAELWADEKAGESGEQARDIVAEVDRLEQWVRSLLTYAGQGRATLETIDLNDLVKAAFTGYQREFARFNIETRFELADKIPKIFGNRELLVQMLNSLIANAIEAMPNGGTLAIRSRLIGNKRKIELQLADTGEGISEQQLQKIFQPFSTSKRKGLGLGLALVKRTLERIGGSIRIDSQIGRGTQATLVFPVENL